MSVIFTEKTLIKIEEILGLDLFHAYEKIWGERVSVKNYLAGTPLADEDAEQTPYWEYKKGEIDGVIRNQTSWLYKIAADIRGVLSKEENIKLIEYLKVNDPCLGEELWEPYMEDRYP